MCKYYNTITDIAEIPNYNYEGYIWMSNENKPDTIKPIKDIQKELTSTNPYIVEGNLYSEDKNISISIKNTGEGIHIMQFDIGEAEEDQNNQEVKKSQENNKSEDNSKEGNSPKPRIVLQDQIYIANGLGEIKVKFKQAWIAENDENCVGMPVLQPAWRAFVGFEPKIKED
jgi:CRISPR type III-associated protein (TIGR04423 family)